MPRLIREASSRANPQSFRLRLLGVVSRIGAVPEGMSWVDLMALSQET